MKLPSKKQLQSLAEHKPLATSNSKHAKLLSHHLNVAINQAYMLNMDSKQLRSYIEKELVQRGF